MRINYYLKSYQLLTKGNVKAFHYHVRGITNKSTMSTITILLLIPVMLTLLMEQISAQCGNLTSSQTNNYRNALRSTFPKEKYKLDFIVILDKKGRIYRQNGTYNSTLKVTDILFNFLIDNGRIYIHKDYARVAVLAYGQANGVVFEGIREDPTTACEVEGKLEGSNDSDTVSENTTLLEALQEAERLFRTGDTTHILWLFSDGQGVNNEVKSKLSSMKEKGVTVFTALVGTNSTVEEAVRDLATGSNHSACLADWEKILDKQLFGQFDKLFAVLDSSSCTVSCATGKVCACDVTDRKKSCIDCNDVEDSCSMAEKNAGFWEERWFYIAAGCVSGTVVLGLILCICIVVCVRRRHNADLQTDHTTQRAKDNTYKIDNQSGKSPKQKGQPKQNIEHDKKNKVNNKVKKENKLQKDPTSKSTKQPGESKPPTKQDISQQTRIPSRAAPPPPRPPRAPINPKKSINYANLSTKVKTQPPKVQPTTTEDGQENYENIQTEKDEGYQYLDEGPIQFDDIDMAGWGQYLYEEITEKQLLHACIFQSNGPRGAWTTGFRLSPPDMRNLLKAFTQSDGAKAAKNVKIAGNSYVIDLEYSSDLLLHAVSSKKKELYAGRSGDYLIVAVANHEKRENCEEVVHSLYPHFAELGSSGSQDGEGEELYVNDAETQGQGQEFYQNVECGNQNQPQQEVYANVGY